jgi:signal transduction histidine kinase
MEANNTAAALEGAIIFVREEEQKRILKRLHDQVVPHLVVAMFEAQSVKMESKGIQEDEALSKMIERLVKAVSEIESIADIEEMHGGPELAIC